MNFKTRLYKNNVKIFSNDLAHWIFDVTIYPKEKTKLLKQAIKNLPIGDFDIIKEYGYITIDTEIYTTSMNRNFLNYCIKNIKNELFILYNSCDFEISINKSTNKIDLEYLPWPDSTYAKEHDYTFTSSNKLKIIHCLKVETEYFKNIKNFSGDNNESK